MSVNQHMMFVLNLSYSDPFKTQHPSPLPAPAPAPPPCIPHPPASAQSLCPPPSCMQHGALTRPQRLAIARFDLQALVQLADAGIICRLLGLREVTHWDAASTQVSLYHAQPASSHIIEGTPQNPHGKLAPPLWKATPFLNPA